MRYPDFAKRFKKACIDAGMPTAQNELGKKLGVSGPMIWNYRNGEKLPSSDKLGEIAKKLNVTVDWLLNGSTTWSLTPDEDELITIFRRLPGSAKSMLIGMAEHTETYLKDRKEAG